MADYIKITPGIGGIQPAPGAKIKQSSFSGQNFGDILNEKIKEKELKISQHAQIRMANRNIHLSEKQFDMLKNAVDKAEQKGVKESLILMGDLAFVVSVKNRTVITAVDGPNIKQNVFTNIDGAVIL